jgi:hypothetical protein
MRNTATYDEMNGALLCKEKDKIISQVQVRVGSPSRDTRAIVLSRVT